MDESAITSLTFADGRGGRPMTWDGSVGRTADRRWSIALDFASAGELRLICTELDVHVVE